MSKEFLFPDFDAAKVKSSIATRLREAGLPEDYIFAFEKTGMLLTPMNADGFTSEDIDEFEAAMAEYNIRAREP